MAKQTDLQPALDAAQTQLELTFSASDALDTKALAILAFNVAIVIFTLQSALHNQWRLLVPLFLCYAVSTYCTIRIIWPSDYRGAIIDINQHPEYLKLSDSELVLQLLVDTQVAITDNSEQNGKKSKACIVAIVLSLIGIGFLTGCII